ncbi:MAG: ABC transporter ATP-binding protein [Firmicutes bacterium]|nr:ABC transporter ATP-binding protein [Bacillota bacterium]
MKRLFIKHWKPMLLVLTVQLFVNLILMGGEVLTKRLVDAALASSLEQMLPLAMVRLLFVALEIGSVIVYQIAEAKCTTSILKKLRTQFAASYLHKSYADVLQTDASDVISRLTNDMSVIQDSGFRLFFMSSLGLLSLAATCAVMHFYSWKLALIAMVITSLMVIPPHLLSGRMTRAQEKRSAVRSAFISCVQEVFSGFEIIVSFGAANVFQKRYDRINRQLADAELSMGKTEALNSSIGQSFSVVAKVMILLAASVLLALQEISTGTLVIFISLIGMLSGNLSIVLQTVPAMRSISPLVERILPEEEEVQQDDLPSAAFTKQLQLANVSFGFAEAAPLFQNVNLEFLPGKKYALIGENGVGKTTLLRLLAGCFPDYGGEIYYDGVPLKSLNRKSLSSVLSIIHQQPFVFQDTILFNITLGADFPEDRISEVARLCGIDRFRDGLQTQIEEHGKNLSGGQRQRISIARALLHDLPLLLIDEGSNALDAEMAADLDQCIFSLKHTAVLAITHDTSDENLAKYDAVFQVKDRNITVMS